MILGNAIEGNEIPNGVDVQFPWEDSPKRYHNEVLQVPTLLVDKYPVTNAEYKQFLLESSWRPSTSEQNWLRHWTDDGEYPEGIVLPKFKNLLS